MTIMPYEEARYSGEPSGDGQSSGEAQPSGESGATADMWAPDAATTAEPDRNGDAGFRAETPAPDAALVASLEASLDCVEAVDAVGRFRCANPAARSSFEAAGASWLRTWAEADLPAIRAALGATRKGRSTRLQARRRCADGGLWAFDVTVAPVGGEAANGGRHDGVRDGAPAVACLVTSRPLADDAAEVERLRGECSALRAAFRDVEHRTRNLFGFIPPLVRMSTRRVRTVEDARASISHRIGALFRSHLLTLGADASERGVSLDDVIDAVLEGHTTAADQVIASGPPTRLATRATNTVVMSLHELADNALKFGALSVPDGRVRIAWALEDEAREAELPVGARGWLRLLWSEQHGPLVEGTPERIGFGTQVVDRMVQSQGGTIEREWLSNGLSVTIELPLYQLGAEPKFGAEMTADAGRTGVARDTGGGVGLPGTASGGGASNGPGSNGGTEVPTTGGAASPGAAQTGAAQALSYAIDDPTARPGRAGATDEDDDPFDLDDWKRGYGGPADHEILARLTRIIETRIAEAGQPGFGAAEDAGRAGL